MNQFHRTVDVVEGQNAKDSVNPILRNGECGFHFVENGGDVSVSRLSMNEFTALYPVIGPTYLDTLGLAGRSGAIAQVDRLVR